ncbi:MAG: hypothetical protein ACFWT5_24455 [Pseudomonas helleri]
MLECQHSNPAGSNLPIGYRKLLALRSGLKHAKFSGER